MKFIISQNSLLTALNLIQRVVSTKQALPILEMVKIKTQNKIISLEATDLTVGVSTTILAQVIDEGECVVPIKSFCAQLATLPQLDLNVSLTEKGVEIATKSVVLSFATGNTSDFPELPITKGVKWKVSKELLFKISALILSSAAKDQIRPILSSVLFVNNEDSLEVVATDGIRLSVYRQKGQNLPCQQILIPSRALLEITKILESAEVESIDLIISEDQQIIESQIGNTRFFSKLVAGEYPPYNKIIPTEFRTKINLDRTDLEENVKRSMLLGGRETGYFQLVIDKDKTVLLTKNQSGESIESIIASRDLDGEPAEIAFSSRYVMDFLKSVSDQEVSLLINDPLKPAVLLSKSEPEFKFVIMPFKVKS